jgi:8-oxo-dGTP pyrophosphatase MutT (NUDIX family)
MAAYEPQSIEHDPTLWPAAVLLLLHNQDGELHVIFQKRTDKVDAHKGQISFPGGGRDPEDEDLIATALRETHEEIGVHPSHVEILGQLDGIRTISNFAVTPYVGWLDHHPYDWQFSHDEVAYLLEVPLMHLRDVANFVPDQRTVGGREIVMPAYNFQSDLIWGATARMLSNFLDLFAELPGG